MSGARFQSGRDAGADEATSRRGDEPTRRRADEPTSRREAATSYAHRRDYADDPTLCDRVFALLDTWIPALSGMRRRAEALRWRWERVSTPFVHERDGRILSHVGVLESRLTCLGEERRVGGVHAVCTLASERRSGLYRALMEEALAHCDERYRTVELCTEHPEYYEPFGFRVVPEHAFACRPAHARGRDGFRSLDFARETDLRLLDRVLDTREPVSRVLGVREKDIFKFNASTFGDGAVQYCPELDLVAVMRRDGRRLELDDVAAARMPALPELLEHIGGPLDEIVFHFRPDRLADPESLARELRPVPTRYGGDVFMVRGELPYGARDGNRLPECMLPPPARH